jgi:hypothetical protein
VTSPLLSATDDGADPSDVEHGPPGRLTSEELLAGAIGPVDVSIPLKCLPAGSKHRCVGLRPLTVGDVAAITRASRGDPALVPALLLTQSLVDPTMSFQQIQSLPAGLAGWLVQETCRLSGLQEQSGAAVRALSQEPLPQAYLTLARRYGWVPDQVDRLTPAQLVLFLGAPEDDGEVPRETRR